MEYEPHQERHISPPFHFYLAGIAISFVMSLVFGLAFYFWPKEGHPWLTLVIIVFGGGVAVYIIYKKNIHAPENHVWFFLVWAFLVVGYYYYKDQPLIISNAPSLPPVLEVAVEELEGKTFSGFHDGNHGGRVFTVLTIEKVEKESSRVLFRYSVVEGLDLVRGQGMIFPYTSTMSLGSGARFHYGKENGVIMLRATGLGYVLAQN